MADETIKTNDVLETGNGGDESGNGKEMTAEERLAELEKQLAEEKTARAEAEKRNAKLKGTLDEKLKTLGDMTKKERERMSAEELERQEIEEIKRQNEVLMKEREIVSCEKRFIQLGCEGEIADEGARALIEKDYDALFGVLGKLIDSRVSVEKGKYLQSMPKPQSTKTSETITKEQFNHMGYKDRVALAEKDPDLYNRLSQ